eukprot:275097-Rhodomonas_salina.2
MEGKTGYFFNTSTTIPFFSMLWSKLLHNSLRPFTRSPKIPFHNSTRAKDQGPSRDQNLYITATMKAVARSQRRMFSEDCSANTAKAKSKQEFAVCIDSLFDDATKALFSRAMCHL